MAFTATILPDKKQPGPATKVVGTSLTDLAYRLRQAGISEDRVVEIRLLPEKV